MDELEIALQRGAATAASEGSQRATDPDREDKISRFYIINDDGIHELRIDHGLIMLWLARRSRLRRGMRRR